MSLSPWPPGRSTVVHLVLTVIFSLLATASTSLGFSIHPCCAAISFLTHNDTVFYPGTIQYKDSTTYFSAFENELSPACVVVPKTTDTLSRIVKILQPLSILKVCNIAVRAGGHTMFAGGANIANGVTIDTRGIRGITVSEDRKITSIGAGERWGDVYKKLDPMGLAVPGGRISNVGVAGLTLGGGISYFISRKGFVCDNVVNFQVVLASGSIVNANQRENSDLWLALKGGSNNFGIVTRFDISTFEHSNMWGGSIFYDGSTFPKHLEEMYKLVTSPNYDVYAHVIISYGFGQGSFVAAGNLYYTNPNVSDPSSLRPFTSIQPQFFNNMRMSTLTDFAEEQWAFSQGSDGARQEHMTITVKPDLLLFHEIWRMWNASQALIQDAAGLGYSVVFQPLTTAMTSKSVALGGNSLGLDGSDNLVLILLVADWDDPKDDKRILAAKTDLVRNIRREAKARKLDSPYIYLNYAFSNQDPISGYGASNKANLQRTSKKYDPLGFFQTSVPGGFKLFS